MDQASASIAIVKDEPGFLLSRRRILQGAVVAAAAIAAGGLWNPLRAFADDTESEADDEALTILRFSSMAGIQRPFLGDAGLSAFRGVHGGGAPWIVSESSGSLMSDGHFKVRVRGLDLDPAFVPAPSGGTNPIPKFMAIVSGFSTTMNPVLRPDRVCGLSSHWDPCFPAMVRGDRYAVTQSARATALSIASSSRERRKQGSVRSRGPIAVSL